MYHSLSSILVLSLPFFISISYPSPSSHVKHYRTSTSHFSSVDLLCILPILIYQFFFILYSTFQPFPSQFTIFILFILLFIHYYSSSNSIICRSLVIFSFCLSTLFFASQLFHCWKHWASGSRATTWFVWFASPSLTVGVSSFSWIGWPRSCCSWDATELIGQWSSTAIVDLFDLPPHH